jgi:hypothetical protein
LIGGHATRRAAPRFLLLRCLARIILRFASFACRLDLQGQQVISPRQTLRVLRPADGLAQALGQDVGIGPLLL